jgi:glycosyltransferase 2 family protein
MSLRPAVRVAAFLALFVAFTAAGVWWAAPPRAVLADSWRQLTALSWQMLLLLGVLSVALVGAQMQRVVVFGRAAGVRVGLRASFDATIADNFFSWITPGAALGDPATIYMLNRHGVPWDAAAVIAFGEFATGFALIMGASCALVALGYGPPVATWVGVSFAVASGGVAVLLLALIAGAFFPAATLRWVERAERRWPAKWVATVARNTRSGIDRLVRFRRAGAAGALALVGSHLVYYGAFVSILVVLAVAFGAPDWRQVVPLAVVYQGFVYVAPTPGGAGIGEASAGLFFDGVVPGGGAFAVVMLFRLLTFYLHVLLGLVYLPIIGALAEILRAKK